MVGSVVWAAASARKTHEFDSPSQDGDTALDLVKRMGYKETVRLLENGCMLQHRHRLNVHAR